MNLIPYGYYKHKTWQGRAVIILLWIYLLFKFITNPQYQPLTYGVDYIVHEAGHVVFGITGIYLLGILGGTIMQLLLPLYVIYNFYRRQEFYVLQFGLFWLGMNLAEIAVYMSDAQSRLLPLVPLLSPEPIHDWHAILSSAGLLRLDWLLGRITRYMGIACMLWAIYNCLMIVIKIRRYNPTGSSSTIPLRR